MTVVQPHRLQDRNALKLPLSFRGRAVTSLAVTVCLLLLVVEPAAASAVKLPYTEIHKVDLANGLRALIVESHDAPVINVQVWYHVGSKNEAPAKTGFAHLFEHLMFDGTKNLGPEEFSDYIVRSGGTDNAYTTEDATVFWETVPSNMLPVVLWLEADRMRNLAITDKVFSNEREVVQEERRLRFDNPPYGNVVETLYAHAYTVHPYQHMTIGSMQDLESASIKDIQDFYDTYYVPNNVTLMIVGDVDWRQAAVEVQKYLGPVEAGKPLNAQAIPQEPAQTAERVVRLDLNVALPAFVEGYHMPADGTPDAYPLRLASKILSDGESSRIYTRLIYETQIAVEAQSTGNFTEDPNLFFVFAILNSGHTPAEGEAQVEAELARLKTELVSDAELAKAQNQILRDFILSRQTVQTRAEELGYAAVVLKDPELINTELARFLVVTPQDIQRVARKYFVPENLTLVEVHPRKEAQERAAASNATRAPMDRFGNSPEGRRGPDDQFGKNSLPRRGAP
jgi:predicted Zn-dependent peptidase